LLPETLRQCGILLGNLVPLSFFVCIKMDIEVIVMSAATSEMATETLRTRQSFMTSRDTLGFGVLATWSRNPRHVTGMNGCFSNVPTKEVCLTQETQSVHEILGYMQQKLSCTSVPFGSGFSSCKPKPPNLKGVFKDPSPGREH
jgi:outer membrane protease